MKYQQDYFNTTTVKSQSVFRRYVSFLQDAHISLNDKKILDIGCATGEFLELLPKGMGIFGIDIAPYVIEKCKKLVPRGTFEVCNLNIQDLGSQATFDLITMFDVVEHLTNMEHLIKILHTNLNPGGYFVLTTPNANSLQRLIARSKSTGEHDMTHTMHHLFNYNM
jgi:2-polyprenyl-3-methyl-5-hydroxy-6-metoxy-1,4-benzoquinol methylase